MNASPWPSDDPSPEALWLAFDRLQPELFSDYRPGFIPIEGRFLWSSDKLAARLKSPETTARTQALILYLDPIGDSASHFEIALAHNGDTASRIVRRNRSGSRSDISWKADDACYAIRMQEKGWECLITLPLPLLGPIIEGSDWLVGAVATSDLHQFRPAPPLQPLRFRPTIP